MEKIVKKSFQKFPNLRGFRRDDYDLSDGKSSMMGSVLIFEKFYFRVFFLLEASSHLYGKNKTFFHLIFSRSSFEIGVYRLINDLIILALQLSSIEFE